MNTTLTTSSYPQKLTINNSEQTAEIAFQQLLDTQDYSDSTKVAFLQDWLSFLSYQEEQYAESFNPLKTLEGDVTSFKRALIESGKKPATVNRRLSSVRVLFRLLHDKGYIPLNPTLTVKRIPKSPLKPKSLSELEVKRFRREVRAGGNLKHAVITDIMLYGGLRSSEVVRLKATDLHLSERSGHVEVRYSKGLKSRSVPLCFELRATLKAYLARYAVTEYLFVSERGSKKGTAITTIGINKIVEHYARKADVKATPHTLRHTMATHWLRQPQGNLISLQQILGHSDIRTTSIYCQNNLQDLQKNVEEFSY